MKAQRAEWDSKHGGPTGRVSGDNHVPDAVPVFVEIVDPDELGIPHRAVRIRSENERTTAVVKTVDQQLDVVVTRQVRVTPQFAGAHVPYVAVVCAHRDVQRRGVPQHLHDGTLARGSARRGLALPEIGDRVRAGPGRTIQATVEGDRDGRGNDTHPRPSLEGVTLIALLCR